MKNLLSKRLLLLILLVVSVVVSVKAQKGDPNADRNDSHYFTISLSGGTSGFNLLPLPDTMRVTTNPFWGGSFGLGYEWQSSTGVWLGVGLEGQILTGKLHNTQDIYRLDEVPDSEGDTADITYNIVTWKEMQRVLYFNLPIMAGYKFESGFYFGLGAKIGVGVYADVRSDFRFTDCVVDYPRFPPMEINEPVDEDDVTSREEGFEGRLKLSPAFEIGWQGLDIKKVNNAHSGGLRFKFALCGEFSALSVFSNASDGNLLNFNTFSDPERFDDLMKVMNLLEGINSYYSTMPIGLSKSSFEAKKNQGDFLNYSKPSNLYSWYIGVKVGILFEIPRKKECNCLENNVIKPWYKTRRNKGIE